MFFQALRLGIAGLLGFMVILIMMGGAAHMFNLRSKPSYSLVPVDGARALHTICEGPKNAPFVLYDAGAFGIYADGWWLLQNLKHDHRICLYDRAGMGWSDAVPNGVSPDPDWHVEDMRRLRQALGENSPFILVGHSMAGLRLHAYANVYPEELRGLVFIDAVRPQTLNPERAEAIRPWLMGAMRISAGLARLGLARGLAYILPDELGLEGHQKRDKRRAIGTVRHHKATRAEMEAAFKAWPKAGWAKQTRAENIPVFVYSNTPGGGANAPVAASAKRNTGLGGVTELPDESHVSLLNAKNAARIAADVRRISQARE